MFIHVLQILLVRFLGVAQISNWGVAPGSGSLTLTPMASSVENYIAHALKGQAEMVVEHASSSIVEREELGNNLHEVSTDWKRTLSPMISLELVQESLIILFRQAK